MMPAFLTGAVAVVAVAASARWNWWRPKVDGLAILMYHKVGTPPPGSRLGKLWVSMAQFRRQMSHLSRHGYTPIVFRDLYAFWDHGTPLPPRPVLITFDDGYQNNHAEAFPILREFGFPATIFVVVQTVGADNRWHDPASETRIQMITWAQLKELRAAGWEIGSHTMSHSNLKKIDLTQVGPEVEKSRAAIGEALGEVPDTFAYPYGGGEDVPAIVDAIRKAGYRSAVTVRAGKWPVPKLRERPFNLPRSFIRGDESMIDYHLNLTRGRCRF